MLRVKYPNFYNLPEGYTQLKYITSTNRMNQWIPIDLPIEETDKLTIRAKLVSETIEDNYMATAGTNTQIDKYTSSWYIKFGSTDSSYVGGAQFPGTIQTFELYKEHFDIDGVTLATPEFISVNGNWNIFGSNYAAYSAPLNLYSFVIKNNTTNEIRFNGIPAKRDSDSAIGIFDLVSNTFKPNAGTNAFTAGPVAEKAPEVHELYKKNKNEFNMPLTATGINSTPAGEFTTLLTNTWYHAFAYNGYANSSIATISEMTDTSMTFTTTDPSYVPARFMALKPSTQYTINCKRNDEAGNIAGFKYTKLANGKWKWNKYLFSHTITPKTFTTDADNGTECLYGFLFYPSDANLSTAITELQVEEGASATEWVKAGCDYIGEAYEVIDGELEHVFSAGWDTTVSGASPFSLTNARAKEMGWAIRGQTSQASTPTPSVPVSVEGVGDEIAWPGQEFNIAIKSSESAIWGCTMTPDLATGRIHLTGTGTVNDYANDSGLSEWYRHGSMIAGHIYYMDMKGLDTDGHPIGVRWNGSSRATWDTPTIFTRGNLGNAVFCWNVVKGKVYDTWFTPQIIDLTKMYGAGNEPDTVEAFKARLMADDLALSAAGTNAQKYPTATSGSSSLFGVTVSALGNGKYRVTGTGTATDWGRSSGFAKWTTTDMCVAGHKYYAYAKGAPSGMLRLRDFNGGLPSITSPVIVTCDTYSYNYSVCTYITSGKVYDYTVEVFLIDLTELYGEGNEPSTVAEFMERKGVTLGEIPVFPYSPTPSKKYVVPMVVNEQQTNVKLDRPVHKLENYTDTLEGDGTLSAQVGVQNLDEITRWSISGWPHTTRNPFFCNTLDGTSVDLALCTHFPITEWTPVEPDHDCFMYRANNILVWLPMADYPDVASFTAWLTAQKDAGTPVQLVYPLATPTETTVDVPTVSTYKGTNTVAIKPNVTPSNIEVTYRKKTQ